MPDDLESKYCHQGYDLTLSCTIHTNEGQWAGASVKWRAQKPENVCSKVITGSGTYRSTWRRLLSYN